MSRFTPLFLFLGLAAAVYLPQSGGEQDIVRSETANVMEVAADRAAKERSADVAKSTEPELAVVATSAETADETLDAFGPPDPDAAKVRRDDVRTETQDAAAADVEEAVIADAEQSEAGHIPSAANSDEIGPALRKLSLFDLKTSAQKHLTRLGCYDATIDGIWGEQSRASLAEFNQRVNGGWTEPNAELIQALRAAPEAICKRDCAADAGGNGCAVATAPADSEAADKGDASAKSYLPPWMRGKELASTDPDALGDLVAPSSGATEAAEPKKRAVQRSSTRRRVSERQWERERRRTYQRKRDWGSRALWPEGR